MRAKLVENIDFRRTGDSKRALDLGIRMQNRDPKKRLRNFEKDHPEVNHVYRSEQNTHAPGTHPNWQLLNISLTNSAYSLEDNKAKYLKWVEDNTDFDIIEVGDGYERSYRPNGDPDKREIFDQSIIIKMRNEEDIS